MRAVYSLMCVLERDFLFFSVSMVSRSRAPVLWDRAKRMTRETDGFIRSLRADANGSFPVQMSRRISSLAVFFERFTFLTFASSWRSARREFTKRAVEESDPPCGRPLSSQMKFETYLSLSLSLSPRDENQQNMTKHNRSRALLPRDQEQTVPEI
jgi:hypothetical protein